MLGWRLLVLGPNWLSPNLFPTSFVASMSVWHAVLTNAVPPCSDYDKEALAALGAEFEIDFVSLAYTRTR